MLYVLKSLLITLAISLALLILLAVGSIGFMVFVFFMLGVFVYRLSQALNKYLK